MHNRIKKSKKSIFQLGDIFKLRMSVCILLCLLSSCNLFTTNGNVGYTGSILQSKKTGVFISEYRPLTNNDSLFVNIKSAWIEHSWRYDGLSSEKVAIDSDSFHLIIKTDKKGLNDCFEKWLISVNEGKYFACASGEGLIGTFHTLPEDSIIKCKVEKRLGVDKSSSTRIIGYIVLKRIGSYKSGSVSKEVYHGKLFAPSNIDMTKGKK